MRVDETFKKVDIKDIEDFSAEVLESYAKEDKILWLVYLSTLDSKFFFKKYFNQIIKTPDDLFMFVQACRKGKLRSGLGRCEKREINNWLHSNILMCSPKQKAKLRDVIRITHPKFKNDTDFQNAARQILDA